MKVGGAGVHKGRLPTDNSYARLTEIQSNDVYNRNINLLDSSCASTPGLIKDVLTQNAYWLKRFTTKMRPLFHPLSGSSVHREFTYQVAHRLQVWMASTVWVHPRRANPSPKNWRTIVGDSLKRIRTIRWNPSNTSLDKRVWFGTPVLCLRKGNQLNPRGTGKNA